MRSRSIGPFAQEWASNLITTLPSAAQPMAVPFRQMLYWYWRVAVWEIEWNVTYFDVDTSNDISLSGSIQVSYNATNNASLNPVGPGPRHEADLPIGYQITYTGGAGDFISSYEFLSSLGGFSLNPIYYTDPDSDAWPILRLSCLLGTSGETQSGGISLTIDGVEVPISTTSQPNSGSITINPVAWFPYRKSDGTSPKYDSTTGTELLVGRLLDELP